jgi:hypothetical protein
MSFGTPTLGLGDPDYEIEIHFASPPSDPPHAVVTVVSAAGASSESDMDTLMQMLVDLVDSSSDLVVSDATKTKLSIQVVSPT